MRSVQPDEARAKAMTAMALLVLERAEHSDHERYASIVLRDYYDAIRELMAALLLRDGFVIDGKGAHERLIHHLCQEYAELARYEQFLQQLRDYRNRISYEGFFISPAYLARNRQRIRGIVTTLKRLATSARRATGRRP